LKLAKYNFIKKPNIDILNIKPLAYKMSIFIMLLSIIIRYKNNKIKFFNVSLPNIIFCHLQKKIIY